MDHYRRKFLIKSLVLLSIPSFIYSKSKESSQPRSSQLAPVNIVSDSGTYVLPKRPKINESIHLKIENIQEGRYAKILFQDHPILNDREDLELDNRVILE